MKTLILKDNNNNFEQYFIDAINADQRVDVYAFFNGYKFLRRIANKLHIRFPFSWQLGEWKKFIDQYETVIVFDRVISEELCRWIKSQNNNCKIKVWFWNIPNYDYNNLRKYCSLYIFDKDYANKNNMNYIQQFFVPQYNDNVLNSEEKYDVIYVGADKNRYDILNGLASELSKDKINYHFVLLKDKNKKYSKTTSVSLINKTMDYTDVLRCIQGSKCILELNLNNQSGLTLRALEALFYKKKLITNNTHIKRFSFYNQSNIYILNEDKRSFLEFLNEPYVDVDESVMYEYTLNNWISMII